MNGDPRPTYRHPLASPLEAGLRLLFVLDQAAPAAYDLDRLLFCDYLLVHSADADGPPSLHPAMPYRSGEWLVRRELVRKGLDLMASREVASKQLGEAGVTYTANELTRPFLAYLTSDHAGQLRLRAAWILERFGTSTDEDLTRFMAAHVDRWGAEFRESVLRGAPL